MYQLGFYYDLFVEDCFIWKHHPAPYKIWPQFKLYFTHTFQEYREIQVNTPTASGFHVAPTPTKSQAEKHTKTINEIANLETATADNNTTVANLITTNAEFLKELDAITSKLVMSMTKVALFKQKIYDCSEGNKGGRSGHISLNNHYYWSCSYLYDHSYWYCTATNPDHQKWVKAFDIMVCFHTKTLSWGKGGTNNNVNINSCNYITQLVPTIPEATVDDSGCTSHLIKSFPTYDGKAPTGTGLFVWLSNVTIIQAPYDATLNLDHIPVNFSMKEKSASVLPYLVKKTHFLL